MTFDVGLFPSYHSLVIILVGVVREAWSTALCDPVVVWLNFDSSSG